LHSGVSGSWGKGSRWTEKEKNELVPLPATLQLYRRSGKRGLNSVRKEL
jgi:hypothetical protein